MSEQFQDDIQAYLDGTMPIKQRAAFEAQIGNSPQLVEEMRRHRMLRVVARHEDLFAAKAMVGNVMAEVEIEADYGKYRPIFDAPNGGGTFLRWMWLAIGLLVVSGGGWFYRYRENQQQIQHIAAAQLAPLDNMIGFAPGDPSNAAAAMRAYEQRDYPEAIRRLEAELRAAPDDNGLRLYLAVSLLMQGRQTDAEPLLRQMAAAQDLTKVPATWYLALCLLRQGQPNNARELLVPLRADTIFGQRAQQVLDALQ